MSTTVLTAKFDFSQPKSAIKGTQAQIDQLKNKAKGAQGALDNAGKSAKGAGVASAFFGKAAKGAVPGVAALGGALKAALGPIALLTSAAGVLTSAFSTLAEQDFAEAKVRTLGVNSEELKGRLSDVSRELSGQASVVELTAAAYDVASAGFNDAASASQVLKASSLAATGGFSDLNTVADATTSVLNSYGLGAEQASRITDQFIQTQNDGKIVIGQYAANIAKVAPVAAALGIGLDEVNAAVAQITGTGTGAEVTFTALKTAFAQLASGGVGEKLKEFGVNIDANSIAADGFVGTLKKIKDSGADTGAILKAFGTEAGPVLQPLLNDFDKLNQLVENQRNSQGEAAKSAFEAGNTIKGALNRLQSAFTNIFASGSELGELLKGTFQVAAVTVEAFGAALKLYLAPLRGLIDATKKIANAFSPLKEGVNIAFELEEGWKKVLGAFDTLSKKVTAFASVYFQTVAKLIGVVVNLGININKALGNPIGKLFNLYGQLREFLFGIFGQIGQAASNFFGGFVSNAGEAVTNVVKFFGGLFSELAGIINRFEGFLPGWLKDSLSGATGAAKNVVGAIATAVNSVKEIVQAVPEKLATFTVETVQQKSTETASAANAIQQTGGGLAAAGGKTTATTEKETPLQKQQKAAKALLASLKRKNELDATATDQERKQLELKFAKADIEERFKLLSKDKIKALKDELQNNFDITEEKQKQLELAKEAQKEAEKLNEIYKGIGDTLSTGVHDAIMGAVEGTKTLGEVASGVLKTISNQLMKFALGGFGGKDKNSGSGILGAVADIFRADGGPVNAGRSYVVGERGPEVFTPSRSGSIVPNHAMGGSMGIVVNVDASGSSVEGQGEQASQLGKMLGSAVQAELIKQKRPGGLLAT